MSKLEGLTKCVMLDMAKALESARESTVMVKQQIFGQQMMENLINDLLDLAQITNNTFKMS